MVTSRIFLYFCLSFILGIFLNSSLSFSQIITLEFLIIGVFLISIFWQRKGLVVAGFCFLFLAIGVWHHQQAILEIISPEEGEVCFIGSVVAEPDIREDHLKLTVESASLSGKILVNLPRYPEYHYGDRLKISGSLNQPDEDIEGFNYKNYLAKEKIYAVIYQAEAELLTGEEKGFKGWAMTMILSFKDKLRQSLDNSLPSPQSEVIGAMILGDKNRLPEGLKEKLNFAGLRHITAISGMHLVIVGSILSWLAISLLKLGRNSAFYFTVGWLFFFIIMIGLPSSAVRAGIMFTIMLYGAKEGRLSSSGRALIFTAGFMLIQNPLLLTWDVGFQLSFLACLGIIYLGPVFRRLIGSGQFNFFRVAELKDLLAASLAAQIFTLPILIYNFGYFSQVAPLANILVVPWLPLIIIFGLLSGLVGIVCPFLGLVLSWPLWLLLSFLIALAGWLADLPFSAVYFEISWIWLAILYLILVGIVFYSRKWIENSFRSR